MMAPIEVPAISYTSVPASDADVRELFPMCALCGRILGPDVERLEGRNRLAHRSCIALKERRVIGDTA